MIPTCPRFTKSKKTLSFFVDAVGSETLYKRIRTGTVWIIVLMLGAFHLSATVLGSWYCASLTHCAGSVGHWNRKEPLLMFLVKLWFSYCDKSKCPLCEMSPQEASLQYLLEHSWRKPNRILCIFWIVFLKWTETLKKPNHLKYWRTHTHSCKWWLQTEVLCK